MPEERKKEREGGRKERTSSKSSSSDLIMRSVSDFNISSSSTCPGSGSLASVSAPAWISLVFRRHCTMHDTSRPYRMTRNEETHNYLKNKQWKCLTGYPVKVMMTRRRNWRTMEFWMGDANLHLQLLSRTGLSSGWRLCGLASDLTMCRESSLRCKSTGFAEFPRRLEDGKATRPNKLTRGSFSVTSSPWAEIHDFSLIGGFTSSVFW